jgi:dynein heavy chain
MTLTAAGGKIPKDLSWPAGKKYMGNVDAFLKSLLNFDKDNVPVNCVDACEKEYISNPNFNADYIRSKSSAAAGLCGWVVNICKYFRIYQVCSLAAKFASSGFLRVSVTSDPLWKYWAALTHDRSVVHCL